MPVIIAVAVIIIAIIIFILIKKRKKKIIESPKPVLHGTPLERAIEKLQQLINTIFKYKCRNKKISF